MITLVEALNFRCFRYLHQPLDSFHVIVGPNGSGKSAFMDVLSFLSDLFNYDLETAVNKRTTNFHDLVWGREDNKFEIAIEVQPPKGLFDDIGLEPYKWRYELAIGIDDTGKLQILTEQGYAFDDSDTKTKRTKCAGDSIINFPQTLMRTDLPLKVTKGQHRGFISDSVSFEKIVDTFDRSNKTWQPSGMMLENTKTPVLEWLLNFLKTDVKDIELNVGAMCKASPPGQGSKLNPDGSNLPWVVKKFKTEHKSQFNEWVKHLSTGVKDIDTIMTRTREDDKHCYLMIKYKNGLEVPSWCISDGTLRMLALTLPAYLPNSNGIYLVEEPENGVHPLALETIYQSLSSIYGGQVLVATHSPLFVSFAEPEEILCFSKDENGATQIISGDKHPMLKDWSKRVDLGTMFASGVFD